VISHIKGGTETGVLIYEVPSSQTLRSYTLYGFRCLNCLKTLCLLHASTVRNENLGSVLLVAWYQRRLGETTKKSK
jgi:hypothetical protein